MKLAMAALASMLILGAAGFFVLQSNSDKAPAAKAQDSSTTASSNQENSLVQQTLTPGGEIVAYAPAALASSDAETNIVFFHATWCVVCNSVERNLEAGVIPEGMRIFKVDFDSDIGQDLADEYSIPIQYTMVQVDTSGNELTQWVNQSFFTIEDILERVQTT